MKTVSVPNLDFTGDLSPLIFEALDNGATAALDPADPHNTLVVAFKTDAQAKAFKAKVSKALKGGDHDADAEGSLNASYEAIAFANKDDKA